MTGSRHDQHSGSRRPSLGDFIAAAMPVLWVLIAVAGLLTMGFTFYPEWTRLSEMKQDLASQQKRLAELKKRCADHQQEVNLLLNDPAYLEMIARDKLDLMKEGETIFRLSSAQPRP
jgi:cell division protein FtsB